ncbi:unnamed protein product [Phyllotreta striolata]|uniref:Tetraspanin n=1 Tax=Phyllotreta striolata TaxID=444603 RepID=A0A9N9XN98_PHYSR|nr:unnamed protein product [Phyllotreta striolata]
MENCGMSLIKYLLFIFNFLFALSGLGVIITGAVVLSNVSDFNHFLSSDLLGPPVVLIVAGVIVFVIAFLGCFGAIKESYNMLMAFGGLLIIIFIMEIAVGVTAAVYRKDFQENLKQSLLDSIKRYTNGDVDSEKMPWHNVQQKLKCCGVNGPADWQGQNIPLSCCTEEQQQETVQYCTDYGVGNYMYQKGCFAYLTEQVEQNAKVLVGVGIGIAFIEIIGIVLACWLAFTIKKEQSEK